MLSVLCLIRLCASLFEQIEIILYLFSIVDLDRIVVFRFHNLRLNVSVKSNISKLYTLLKKLKKIFLFDIVLFDLLIGFLDNTFKGVIEVN